MADPVLLFRYSALTFNGHRIHYDRDYVTKVEGYPGLIFHGPMQAALIVEFAAKLHGGTAPKKFSYRGRAAAVRRQRVQRQRQRDRRRHGVVDREFGGPADHEGHRDVVTVIIVIPACERSEAIHRVCAGSTGLLRRFAPRNDGRSISSHRARDDTLSANCKTSAKSVTVKQATLDLLRAFGIKKVFGNPGSTELPFLSDWPDDIDYVLGLQEASVVGMADGYAQATRNAGFVNLHSAAGVGNALGNIYTAHRNQTPLVITAGQQARSILPLQAFLYAERASEFPRPYVKFSVEPARAEDVPAAIARAYYVAMQPPCGPTFVSVPIDDWTHPDATGRGAPRQPRARPRSGRDEGAGRSARGKQAPGARRRPRRRSRAGRRSDGAGRGEGQSRGLGQPVLGALQFSGTASAIRGLPACLAGAAVGRACARMIWWS